MSAASQPVVEAVQRALAAEQQALFGYALLGPALPAADQDRARTDQAVHEQRMLTTAALVAATGATPVAARAQYPGLDLASTDPRTLAARLEDACAAGWRFVYARASAVGAVPPRPAPAGSASATPTSGAGSGSGSAATTDGPTGTTPAGTAAAGSSPPAVPSPSVPSLAGLRAQAQDALVDSAVRATRWRRGLPGPAVTAFPGG